MGKKKKKKIFSWRDDDPHFQIKYIKEKEKKKINGKANGDPHTHGDPHHSKKKIVRTESLPAKD
jgi:hypothetical protein